MSVELIDQLRELKESYCRDGTDLCSIEEAFRQRTCAQTWLRRNKRNQSHPQTGYYKNVVESNRELASKHQKINNLCKRIEKKSREEAPARSFLIIYELFQSLDREPLSDDAFEKAMRFESVNKHLHNTLSECDKGSLFGKAAEKLNQLDLQLGDGYSFSWQTFWYFNLIKDELENAVCIHVTTLYKHVRRQLLNAFKELVLKLRRIDVICVVDCDSRTYCLGPGFADFDEGTLVFSEREILAYLINTFEDEYDENDDGKLPTLLNAINSMLDAHDQESFEQSLQDLELLDFCVLSERTVTFGMSLALDNSPWLAYSRVPQVSRVELQDINGNANQCE